MTDMAFLPGYRRLAGILLAGLLSAVGAGASAQESELNPALNETVIMVPKKAVFGNTELETTLYMPDGVGPFPVVIVNHGKSAGDPRLQSRYRPVQAARYFMERGYVVVVPMRQGFSKSTGGYIGGGCNVESNGRAQAEDVKTVLDYVMQQPYADKDKVLMMGQSHGGWTTLAFGALNYPGLRGLVNFAGGLRQDGCAGWQSNLARSVAGYAAETRLPSLWFYGDNDSYFAPSTWQPMLEQYNGAGGKARMVAFGKYASDAHSLFGSSGGRPIWQPELARFLDEIGMPSQPVPDYARFAPAPLMAVPPKTGFAEITDEPPLPFITAEGKAGYQAFLTKDEPRAFAIAPTGYWVWAEGGEDPLQRAMDTCNTGAAARCKLYAVDNDVVWNQP
jgi:dienelactone hydrolase